MANDIERALWTSQLVTLGRSKVVHVACRASLPRMRGWAWCDSGKPDGTTELHLWDGGPSRACSRCIHCLREFHGERAVQEFTETVEAAA